MYKVIFHLNQEEKIKDALRNIENLLEDLESEGESVEVELLAHSSGVEPFKKKNKEHKEMIGKLIKKGIKIALCNNTLKTLQVKKEDFLEDVLIVPSGVGELTRKQHEGWSYIKP